jgi:hypothetical protein
MVGFICITVVCDPLGAQIESVISPVTVDGEALPDCPTIAERGRANRAHVNEKRIRRCFNDIDLQ